MTTASLEKRLTPEELAERWDMPLGRDFWAIIDDQAVPFLYLGQGTPRKGGKGQRGRYRFRPEAIAKWERDREQSFEPRTDPVETKPAGDQIAKALAGKASPLVRKLGAKKGPRRK